MITLSDRAYADLSDVIIQQSAELARLQAEKRDGLALISSLRNRVSHWRQLYWQTQEQYVKLHGDWVELKRRHDKKCQELVELYSDVQANTASPSVPEAVPLIDLLWVLNGPGDFYRLAALLTNQPPEVQ